MQKLFLSTYTFFKKHTSLLWLILVILVAISAFFAAKISVEEDVSEFYPKSEEFEEINYVFRNLNFADKLIVSISIEDSISLDDEKELLKQVADVFADSLTTKLSPDYIKNVFYTVDEADFLDALDFINGHLPFFLDEEDYKQIEQKLNEECIAKTLKANVETLSSPSSFALKNSIIKDPLHIASYALSKLNNTRLENNYETEDGYIFSKDKKRLMLFITATHPTGATKINDVFISALDKEIEDIESLYDQSINISYFGGVAVGVCNARQTKQDSYWSIAIALVLIIALLLLFFKEFKVVVLILLPISFGVLIALAAMYLISGEISALAIGAGSAIFGIGLNYSLHYFTHKKHTGSIIQTLKDISSPMTIGSLTTIGAFFSLMFVSSDALRDFGLFSALSLLGAIVFVLIIMPHFVRKRTVQTKEHTKDTFVERIASLRFDNKWVFLVILVITILLGRNAKNVEFDADMASLNYMTEELIEAEKELNSFSDFSDKGVYLVAFGDDLNTAFANNERANAIVEELKNKGAIHRNTGMSDFLLSKAMQEEKIAQWDAFWNEQRKSELKQTLINQGVENGFKSSAFKYFFTTVDKPYEVVAPDVFVEHFDFIAREYVTLKDERKMIVSVLKIDPEQQDYIDQELASVNDVLVFDSRKVSSLLIQQLSVDFNFVLWVCGVLVFVFLFINFGRIELTLISFIPMAISWLWILGLMAIFDIKFNIINIVLSTFIFGLGDDFSIFIMDGLRHEYSYRRNVLASYKSTVLLSSATMLIGIGVLIFAKHPAMRSLAQVTIIGMLTVVVVSYTVSPFLFKWLTKNIKGDYRQTPIVLIDWLKTVVGFSIFLVGSILLSLYGFFVITIGGKSKKNKIRFHKALQWASGFVVKFMFGVSSQIVNEAKENFDKPAIVISNHQAHIDLVLMMMITPKLIILTNKWVWNSPFYGTILRYADFIPIYEGIENHEERISELVDEGYSIVIFPEGTRSITGHIKRFKKGAFYIAERLKLDIIPVVLHGANVCVRKPEIILRKGRISVDILPRILADDTSYGDNYSQRAKQIRKYYNEQYLKIRKRNETPDYFKSNVIHHYLYRDAMAASKVRRQITKYNCYSDFISQIPDGAKVLDVCSSYANFTLLLSSMPKLCTITAICNNEDEHSIAKHIGMPSEDVFLKDINFLASANEEFDVVVLFNEFIGKMDALHLGHLIKDSLHLLKIGGKLLMKKDNISALNSIDAESVEINELNELVVLTRK